MLVLLSESSKTVVHVMEDALPRCLAVVRVRPRTSCWHVVLRLVTPLCLTCTAHHVLLVARASNEC